MYPSIFKIGSFSLHSYGLMLAVAFIVGIFIITNNAKREGINPDIVLDLAFYMIIAGVVGARLQHVIAEKPDWYVAHPLDIFKVWQGGLAFLGGFILAVIVAIIYVRHKKQSFLLIADIFAPAIAIGYAFGRTGCTLAGCCYGKVLPKNSHFPGIVFTDPASLAYDFERAHNFARLYPTELIGVVSGVIIFLILIIYKPYRKAHGELILLFTFLYSVYRSLVEIIRADLRGGLEIAFAPFTFRWVDLFGPGDHLLQISTSQLISVPLGAAALIYLFILRRRADRAGQKTK